jgi:hypothetical protein
MSSLISAVSWVRRGVAAQHPAKYVLDDKELERVSALSRIQLEDARIELERAHEAAKSMGLGAEGEEADDAGEDNEEDWVEFVSVGCRINLWRLISLQVRTMRMPWMWTQNQNLSQSAIRMIFQNIIWTIMTTISRLLVRFFCRTGNLS